MTRQRNGSSMLVEVSSRAHRVLADANRRSVQTAARWAVGRWSSLLIIASIACNREAVTTSAVADDKAGPSEADAGGDERLPSVTRTSNSQIPESPVASSVNGSRGADEPSGAPTAPSTAPTSPSRPTSDGGVDGQTTPVPTEPAVICPSVYDGQHKVPALLATDGEEAAFMFTTGDELRVPFGARSGVEVWGNRHFALFYPATGWDVVVLSLDGATEHNASGAFSQFHNNFRIRSVRLDADGTLTADYTYENHDWLSSGPVRDLMITSDGAAREVVIADTDALGFTPYQYGLADTNTGALREAPDRGTQLVHFQRGGLWMGAYLATTDGVQRLVLIDAEQTRSFVLGPEVPRPRRLVPAGEAALVVLTQRGDGIPVLRFDLATEELALLVDVNASPGLTGVREGDSYVAQDSSQPGARWLVDVSTGVTVELSALDVTRASVVTGAQSWFLIEDGTLVAQVSRATGKAEALPEFARDAEPWPLQGRLFLLKDGVLSATLDLTTGDWSSLETGDISIDDLVPLGDWVVGIRAGLPVLRLRSGSTVGEALDPTASEASVSYQAFDDWLLFIRAGRPLLVVSRDGALSAFGDHEALLSADEVKVEGDWAFGFAATEGDAVVTQTIVWRANLTETTAEAIPEPPGYDRLFAARYFDDDAGNVPSVGPGFMKPTDRGHEDGWVTALRRDASSSRVLGYGLDAQWHEVGDAMPSVFNVDVTRGDGFVWIAQDNWSCFCPPPDLAWEETDALDAPRRQLVLTTSQPFEIYRQSPEFAGTLSIHPSNACVAWSDASEAFAFDGRRGERVDLPAGNNWRWLNER